MSDDTGRSLEPLGSRCLLGTAISNGALGHVWPGATGEGDPEWFGAPGEGPSQTAALTS